MGGMYIGQMLGLVIRPGTTASTPNQTAKWVVCLSVRLLATRPKLSWVFQQENAPIHTSKVAEAALKGENAVVLALAGTMPGFVRILKPLVLDQPEGFLKKK